MPRVAHCLVLFAALGAIGCAAGNRVRGNLAGRPFHAKVTRADYCAHCGGGILVSVTFRRPGAGQDDWRLTVETDACIEGYSRDRELGLGATNVYRWRKVGDSEEAVEGEIAVDECSKSWLKASFWARFEDGSHVSGDIATPLNYDAGYD